MTGEMHRPGWYSSFALLTVAVFHCGFPVSAGSVNMTESRLETRHHAPTAPCKLNTRNIRETNARQRWQRLIDVGHARPRSFAGTGIQEMRCQQSDRQPHLISDLNFEEAPFPQHQQSPPLE